MKQKRRNNEYSAIVRRALHDDGFDLSLSLEQFIKLRRILRRKNQKELANSAIRACFATIGLPASGSLQGQPIRNLAALAIASKRIAKIAETASQRLEKLGLQTKASRARNSVREKLSRKEFHMALGK